MHDVDRTTLEFDPELDALEADGYELEFEADDAYPGEVDEGVFDEVEEMELAAELLEIQDEAELDQFVGKLLKKAGRFVRSPAGKALGGILRTAARKALPVVGGAIGNMLVPGVGGAVGGRLAAGAGRMFGLELEGLSPQDQEFEVARRFVRFAGDAARNVALMPQSGSPQGAATAAAIAAAKRHAPGLLRRTESGSAPTPTSRPAGRASAPGGRGASGRWFRRGRTIVLVGL